MLKSDPSTWTDPRHVEGLEAEQLADELLQKCGYRVVSRRFRVGHHDIDLVARKGSLVVFVEVRFRKTKRFGTPSETIGPGKKRDLARAAEAWMQRFGRAGDSVRFDVIGVLGQRVEWVQSAFRPGWR